MTTSLSKGHHQGATIAVEGTYPFSDSVKVTVRMSKEYHRRHRKLAHEGAGDGGGVPFRFRIPCWVTGATVDGIAAKPCTFFNATIASSKTVAIEFQNDIRIKTWNASSLDGQQEIKGGAIEVHRGALLYALRPEADVAEAVIAPDYPAIKSRKVTIKGGVQNGATWNYGILASSLKFVGGDTIPPQPFDTTTPPINKIEVVAKSVPWWTFEGGPTASPLNGQGVQTPPRSPLISNEPAETIELVPYGATNIRISVFPQLCPTGATDCAVEPPPTPPQPPSPSPPPPAPVPPGPLPPNAVANMNQPSNDIVAGGMQLPHPDPALCFQKCTEHNQRLQRLLETEMPLSEAMEVTKCVVWTYSAEAPSSKYGNIDAASTSLSRQLEDTGETHRPP